MEQTAENKISELVQQCMDAYGVKSVRALAEASGVPSSTLGKWAKDGVPAIGAILLNALIENARLRKQAAAIIEVEDRKAAAIDELRGILASATINVGVKVL